MANDSGNRTVSRRTALRVGSAFGVASLSGCLGLFDSGQNAEVPALSEFRGSGALAEGRPAPDGTSIEDLPDLSGDLALYIGGGEGGIYYEFVEMLQEIYPDFEVHPNDNDSASLAQTIVEEVDAGATQADVFWSIDASSLGFVAENDAYESLSDAAVDEVANDQFVGADSAWAGVAGRARAVPYNTDELSASDIPNSVQEFPGTEALQGTMGWAPTYGAFKSFVTAMRLTRGEDETRQWLVDMQEAGTERHSNEFAVSQTVANGALSAGFANHYYAMRVKNDNPDAPIDLAFTEGDAGALINVAGALKVQGTQRGELADAFIRHLLSAEAQEYFATRSFAYPMIAGVEPVGGLPSIDELSPPDIDLAALADLEPTLDLMDEAGVSG
ncbi:extracellular solute-binding protein [Natrinema salifodinae]|uniref:Iron(III) transport system substrate-binding protein n=1 Tax=Natrinema salifodinae TaxID=1202768 RepID=A0A1I0PEA4_9EURY|nr:extracellular solute-binding protein [Natrinema salifodinae]SEW12565.1 iron(III) transport system substrate-binding protein [Natrinema salifodinae]